MHEDDLNMTVSLKMQPLQSIQDKKFLNLTPSKYNAVLAHNASSTPQLGHLCDSRSDGQVVKPLSSILSNLLRSSALFSWMSRKKRFIISQQVSPPPVKALCYAIKDFHNHLQQLNIKRFQVCGKNRKFQNTVTS